MEGRGHSAGGSSRMSAVGSGRGGVPDGSVTALRRVKVGSWLLSLRPPAGSLKLLRSVSVFFR